MLKITGIITRDTLKKVYKPANSDKEYPWRQIEVSREGFNLPYPISVLPDFADKDTTGEKVELDVEVVVTQKGVSNGGILKVIKLQEIDLFKTKSNK